MCPLKKESICILVIDPKTKKVIATVDTTYVEKMVRGKMKKVAKVYASIGAR